MKSLRKCKKGKKAVEMILKLSEFSNVLANFWQKSRIWELTEAMVAKAASHLHGSLGQRGGIKLRRVPRR